MTRTLRRIAFLAAIALAAITLSGHAFAAGTDEPAKPATSPGDKTPDTKTDATKTDAKPADAKPADPKAGDKPADKKSDLDFRKGYKLAYDAIYNRQDYAAGIVMLRALGQDRHPDVANLIGFSSRKLGRTEEAKHWYETALAADPNHTRTHQYFGMWHLERGDRVTAEQHLEKIRLICGQGCEDYASLRDALNGNMTY